MEEEGTNGYVLRYRVTQLEKAVQRIESKIDKTNGRMLGLMMTIAAAAVTFALTVLAGGIH